MTQSALRRCRWCGEEFPVGGRVGRPPEYCRRSHRQRAFEARRAATRLDLPSDAVIVSLQQLDDWRDRLYVLEAALEDVQRDLAGAATMQDYAEAYLHLLEAALGVKGVRIEPSVISGS